MERSIGRDAGARPRAWAAARLGGALALLLLGACAAPPAEVSDGVPAPAPAAPARPGPSTLAVAVDLVSVLVQLDGYSPYGTTVQVNEPAAGFGASLVEALRVAGYGLQVVSDDQGRNYLSYSESSQETETGRQGALEMRLGELSLSRPASVVDGAYVPTGPVTVRGAPAQPVALNGSVHVRRPDRSLDYPSGVRFLDADGGVAAQALYRYVYRPTGAAKSANTAEAPDPTRFVTQAAARLYESGERAFSLRPASDFTPRQTLALRFPGVSDARLGADNRRGLERLAGFFDADTDRYAIASCSPDGRRTDSSAARSARVKAELLTLGARGDQVVELGCPGTGRRTAVNARALAVTLERLNAP